MRNQTFWQMIAHQIVPHSCVLCRAPSKKLNVCLNCINELPWASPLYITPGNTAHPLLFRHRELDNVVVPFTYEVPINHFVKAFKYQGHVHWSFTFASWIATIWPDRHDEQGVWVPVPLHSSRYFERGYNQSLLLARSLSTLLGGGVLPQLLERTQSTFSAAQKRLSPEERALQADASFKVAQVRRLPKTVYLVDDVLTTGATLSAAAHTLKLAGVERIIACVIARTLKG